MKRRNAIKLIGGAIAIPSLLPKLTAAKPFGGVPMVISTWNAGINANAKAWEFLSANGTALDAVEQGVRVTETEISCCVGLGGNPDRDGHVTLDACIMDEKSNCGSVAALERIAHPITVARQVMEKTPHVMLVGEGAQQFALEMGHPLETDILSPDAAKSYREWLGKSGYKPVTIDQVRANGQPASNEKKPEQVEPGRHDTIGMIAMDKMKNVSGACTTSGLGFKMRGRVGDSPIIGAGLFVDNEVGAATATGNGEEMIRIAGSHSVVEFMRQGMSPEEACMTAIKRAYAKRGPELLEGKQICFLAINKQGEYGAYSLRPGFEYAVYSSEIANQLFKSKSLLTQ